MELRLHQYKAGKGWDTAPDASLDSGRTLLLFFGTANEHMVFEPLRELRAAFPRSTMIGCSTAGEIFDRELHDDSVSLAVARFDSTDIRLAQVELGEEADSVSAGERLAEQFSPDKLKAVIVLSDGLRVNGSQLIDGLCRVLPPDTVVTGGLAGDADRFAESWVWIGDTPVSGHVSAVGLYGDSIRIGHGSRGGWDMLGPEREVTHASGNVLYELDGQLALELYKKYLGDRAEGLPATGLLFPLAIRNEDEIDGITMRTILAVDDREQSITFAGDIPQGSYVRLMRANFDRLVDGAADAADAVNLEGYFGGPILNIAISCVGRRLVLGPRVEEEIEAVIDTLPEATRQIGYYSYGEISPLASGRCSLHNQTMTLTAIWENRD